MKFLSIIFLVIVSGFTVPSSIPLPTLFFQKNSIEYNENKIEEELEIPNQTSDSILIILNDVFVDIAKKYSIEIMGHASFDEQNPEELSLKRAEKVAQGLIQLGMDSTRLIVVGYGAKYLLIEAPQLTELNEEEKAAAHDYNRRVSYRIR